LARTDQRLRRWATSAQTVVLEWATQPLALVRFSTNRMTGKNRRQAISLGLMTTTMMLGENSYEINSRE